MATSKRSRQKKQGGVPTFSQVDSPASLFPRQGEDEVRKTTATSGRTCYDLYAKHILPSSWARMLAASLLGATVWYSSKCALTWRMRATKSGRSLFQLQVSAHPIEGNGFGLLLTPRAQETEENPAVFVKRNGDRNHGTYGSVGAQIKYGMLPTPVANDDNKTPEAHMAMKARMKGGPRYKATSLQVVVKMLRTPSASDAEGGVMEIRPGPDARYKLRDEIPHYGNMLPTPNTMGGGQTSRSGKRKKELLLGGMIKMLPTPRLGGFDDTNARALKKGQLHAVVGEKTGLRLQPAFAAWMMGFPMGWLDLEDGEMPRSKARATR